MKRIVEFANDFILNYIHAGDTCVDFTMGNGHDTLFLAKHCYPGKVYAFDIQEEALCHTRQRLENEKIKNVKLILDSHHHLDQYISSFKVGIFNFGYLPGSQVYQPTLLETSFEAVKKALDFLENKGLLILVLYPGHQQGKEESDFLEKWIAQLDTYYYSSFIFKMLGKENCPYLIGIEKKRAK